ncbi:SusC/RagA family TonB-linked outer membrane protein [Kriegella aquimaris]|uniref:TonB-linked outer membrane protein, SusC/RagA family n=1 Tax=Kriegella aquimaris TaxID=192904 RepID=A0A1G9WY95_9FLAO|nr:TonB-dependent receptor [Kriegella aquimaris]SDM89419.1 TonB-linked outer membrane protein, SusC/RagA family [Kriegella aquimaris]
MKNTFIFLIMLCCMSTLYSQDLTISGVVKDASFNEPLPGVSIVVKNTTTGTTTDFDGNFAMTGLSTGDILVFSYIGFVPQEIAIQNSDDLTIVMQDDVAALEEVVVVGYGTQKKSVVTGAISSVKASDLENLPIARVEQALQGRVSGVVIASNSGQPGDASTVRVRGITTFNTTSGGNNPLWVVDGVIVDSGGIGYLNQSDIKSIEVLKDAASLAIYGARAASGVLLITTKTGSPGRLQVNYTGFTGLSGPANKLSLLNASEYGAIMNEKSVAAGGAVLYPNLGELGSGTDWQELIFNDSAIRTSHELSLSAGNDVSTFYASFGFLDQEGIVSTNISNFNRKNFRLNSTHKISDVFTVGQTFGYAHKKTIGLGNTNSEFGGPLSSALNLDPITPAVITNPNIANRSPYNDSNGPVFRDADGNPYGISEIVAQEMTNPLAYEQTRLGNYGWSDDIVGNAYLQIKPMEGLVFKTSGGMKLSYWGDENFNPSYYLNANNSRELNSIYRSREKGFGWNIENTLSYNKVFGKHDFTLLLGQGSYVDNINSKVDVTFTDLPVDNRDDASFNFDIPADQKTAGAETSNDHRVSSIFSRLNYNFDEKYIFTGIIRRDGSSRFGQNNRYGIFPSFSLGWNVFKEGFWKDNNSIGQLKIRGGYGVVGNDAIPDFGYLATVSGGSNYTNGSDGTVVIGYSPDAPDNPDLKWEETAQLNVGFEARLFNDLSVTFDYFKKTTTGILQRSDIPGYVGAIENPLANVADMENSGLELELGYSKTFGEMNFRASGNVSYLKNEVTFLGNDKEFITDATASFQSMGPITRTQVGQSYNSFYGFKTDGIFQNQAEIDAYTNTSGALVQPNASPGDIKWVDENEDGTITDDDKTFIGSGIPKYTFGVTLNADYKGFDAMVFWQGSAGNKIFQGLRRLDIPTANYSNRALSRWTGEGTSNDFPRLTDDDTNGNFSRASDFYLEDGSYVRLKTIQLGYTLPSDVVGKIGVQKLRLYITGENLLTFTKYTGYDPEIGGDILGIDRGYYPQARSYMVGVNLQF